MEKIIDYSNLSDQEIIHALLDEKQELRESLACRKEEFEEKKQSDINSLSSRIENARPYFIKQAQKRNREVFIIMCVIVFLLVLPSLIAISNSIAIWLLAIPLSVIISAILYSIAMAINSYAWEHNVEDRIALACLQAELYFVKAQKFELDDIEI